MVVGMVVGFKVRGRPSRLHKPCLDRSYRRKVVEGHLELGIRLEEEDEVLACVSGWQTWSGELTSNYH